MATAYSQDLRDRVLAAYDRGMQTKQVAETFQVSRAWARRVKQRRNQHGETSARPRGGATVIKIDRDRLRQLVEEQPDATLEELRHRLGGQCSTSGVSQALIKMKMTFKKKSSMRRSKSGPTSPSSETNGRRINPNSTPND